jgi:PKD repeat protein
MYPSDSFETYLTYAGSTWDLQTVHSGYTDAPFSVITYPPTSYHTFELQWRTDSLVKQYVDGNYLLSNTLNVPTSAPYVIAAAYGGGTVTLDWIAAFPVLEYEPTHSTWYTEHYNRANITMPVRHYFPGNDTYYTEQLSINPAETCLVVMDPWGSHEDPLGVPRLVANMNNYLLRLINVTRDYGIQIVYTNYNSAHYINPIVGPCVGDKVWQGSDTEPSLSSFTTYLNSLQLKYIIYSGYHTNYCVIGRPMGMNATSVLTGYRILAVRDCTVAYEGALEPLDFGPEYNWSIKYIESSLGGTTTFSQVMAAFGEDELNFTATPTSGAASLAVDFSAYYNGTIPDTFEWYYGDGVHENTSIATAHHTYGSAGSYTVTANTYFNNSKLGNATKTNYITVSEPTPTPTPAPTPTPEPVLPPEIIDFTGTPTSGEVPLTTSWSCITTGSTPLTYAWSWGDSTANGTTANPSHTYTEAGTYTVILTVTNSAGSNSSVKNNMIVVQAAAAPTTPPDETEDTSFQLGLSGWTLIIFGLIIVALIAIVGFVILRAATGEGDNNMVLPVVVLAIVIIAAIMIGLKIMGGITGL